MFRKIIFLALSVVLFFLGMIAYGFLTNYRSQPLSEILKTKNISHLDSVKILIDRNKYSLKLFNGADFIKEYKVVFGKNKSRIKISKNDYATPSGVYHICGKDSDYIYYKFIHISFPNIGDASEALRAGVITRKEFKLIAETQASGGCPYPNTELGGNIGIHGIGTYNFIFKNLPFVFNWTNGSAAMTNEDIDEIFDLVHIGTEVEIIN